MHSVVPGIDPILSRAFVIACWATLSICKLSYPYPMVVGTRRRSVVDGKLITSVAFAQDARLTVDGGDLQFVDVVIVDL